MSEVITQPAGGTPGVLDNPGSIFSAAQTLAAGAGPIALDVERAGSFRYMDSACLIQVRRNHIDSRAKAGGGLQAGESAETFLFDPQSAPEAVSEALAGVFNHSTWILHSATSDLPSLFELGLRPARLFDTELAGRFLGIERVNLAALVEREFNVTLLKGHGHQNWSKRPLPSSWLDYAALDVEFLIPLAITLQDQLDQAGRLAWFEEECEHIRITFADGGPIKIKDWTSLKGISKLKNPRQLHAARRLWQQREEYARTKNLAVSKVLKDSTLIELAGHSYRRYRDIENLLRKTSNPARLTPLWHRTLRKALADDPECFPTVKEMKASRETKHRREAWWMKDHYPEVWDSITLARDLMERKSNDLNVPAELLLKPTILRSTLVEARLHGRDIEETLASLGARSWQREIATPLLQEALRP